MRSNTVPVKPQQLHYPPEGERGEEGEGGKESAREGEIKTECVRISVMRTDCRSGIQSTAEFTDFWETGIARVMCFNKIRSAWAFGFYTGVLNVFCALVYTRIECLLDESVCLHV